MQTSTLQRLSACFNPVDGLGSVLDETGWTAFWHSLSSPYGTIITDLGEIDEHETRFDRGRFRLYRATAQRHRVEIDLKGRGALEVITRLAPDLTAPWSMTFEHHTLVLTFYDVDDALLCSLRG